MHTTDAAGGAAHIHHHYRSLGHRYVSMAVEVCVACPKPSTRACRSAACTTHCCAVSCTHGSRHRIAGANMPTSIGKFKGSFVAIDGSMYYSGGAPTFAEAAFLEVYFGAPVATSNPTPAPSAAPTPSPTATPSPAPTGSPSRSPTDAPRYFISLDHRGALCDSLV